jgi:hypothetical protein
MASSANPNVFGLFRSPGLIQILYKENQATGKPPQQILYKENQVTGKPPQQIV